MKAKSLIHKMLGRTRDQGGVVLILVLAFVLLMTSTAVFFTTTLKHNIELINRVKYNEQAKSIAEAGINYALARMKANGFTAQSSFTNDLDTGSYSVSFTQTGGRYLCESIGTVGGVSRTVSIEIKSDLPTSLNYVTGAGNDIKINCFFASDVDLNGDIHANNDVQLRSGPVFARLDVTGAVSATGQVIEGSRHDVSDMLDSEVYINGVNNDGGTVTEGAPAITFPSFNYEMYKQEAIASGTYYSGDTIFSSATLSPGSGLVYVDGEATFRGTCHLYGGIVADRITIKRQQWFHAQAKLYQHKSGTRNVIIAKNDDVRIYGVLDTEEALVYAEEDIKSLKAGADVEINGIMTAKRDIRMWDVLTNVNYNYVRVVPDGIGAGEDEADFEVISWNK